MHVVPLPHLTLAPNAQGTASYLHTLIILACPSFMYFNVNTTQTYLSTTYSHYFGMLKSSYNRVHQCKDVQLTNNCCILHLGMLMSAYSHMFVLQCEYYTKSICRLLHTLILKYCLSTFSHYGMHMAYNAYVVFFHMKCLSNIFFSGINAYIYYFVRCWFHSWEEHYIPVWCALKQ